MIKTRGFPSPGITLYLGILLLLLSPAVQAQEAVVLKEPFPAGYERSTPIGQLSVFDVSNTYDAQYQQWHHPAGGDESTPPERWPTRMQMLTKTRDCAGVAFNRGQFAQLEQWYYKRSNEAFQKLLDRSCCGATGASARCEIRAMISYIQPDDETLAKFAAGVRPEQLTRLWDWSSLHLTWSGGGDHYVQQVGGKLPLLSGEGALVGRAGDSLVYITVAVGTCETQSPEHGFAVTSDMSEMLTRDATEIFGAIKAATEKESAAGGDLSIPPWTLVLGGAGALAVAGAVLAGALRKLRAATPRKEQKRDPSRVPPYAYVLQLSANQLLVEETKPGVFSVMAWRIDEKGQYSQATDASLVITSSDPALVVRPASGFGQLQPTVTLEGQAVTTTVVLSIVARAGVMETRAAVNVIVPANYRIETTTMPAGQTQVRVDSDEGIYLHARVVSPLPPNQPDPNVDPAVAALRFDYTAPGCEWLTPSAEQVQSGAKVVYLKVANPVPEMPNAPQPPEKIVLPISTRVAGREIKSTFTLTPYTSELDVDVDHVDFVATQKKTVSLRAFINNPGGLPWFFEARYGSPHGGTFETLSEISTKPTGPAEAAIQLTGPITALVPGAKASSSTLIVSAHQGKEKALERYVKVSVASEGLFLENGLGPNGYVKIDGEGKTPTDVEFGLYALDPKTNQLQVDKVGLAKLVFEMSPEQSREVTNVLSVLKSEFVFSGLVTNVPLGRYRLTPSVPIPGTGNAIRFNMQVSSPGHLGKDYAVDLPLGVETYGIGWAFPEWRKEYEECRIMIERHVPPSGQPDLWRLLDSKKMTLGAEGLYELRKRIHGMAANLILAEGEQGYRNLQWWSTFITEMLEWYEWMGSLAFNVCAASLGPWAPFVSTGKAMVISAIRHYDEGRSVGDFLWEQLHGLFQATQGRLFDVDRLEEWLGIHKAAAWALYVSYHFLYNLYQTQSVVEALKQVLREVRDELIVKFLVGRVKAEAEARGFKSVPPELSKLQKNITRGADGRPIARKEDVLEIMRDPRAVRSLKNAPPEVQEAFNNRRQSIYAVHDQGLKDYLSQKYGIPVNDIKIDDFRTPGQAGSSINTDRDYRVIYKAGTGADGKAIWLEMKKEKFQDKSYELFGKVTDKPPECSARDWATRHQQMPTDKYHIEASPDYSDQAIDPNTGMRIRVKPNIVNVEEGKGKLIDPDALGNMYVEKTDASLRANQTSEAYAQTKKSVDTLEKVRKGYQKQGYDVGELPQNLKRGMEIVQNAPTNLSASPKAMKEFNERLQDAGFKDLKHFSETMAGQFGSLKWAKKGGWSSWF